MASWDPRAPFTHPVDYRLVHNTFVTMFWRRSLLDEATQWLRDHGYDVVSLDAGAWTAAEDMFTDIASALSFPAYFGRNLLALNDCMRDVGMGDYGWSAEATGLVVAFTNFERFAAADRRTAQILLDIFADRARSAMLLGNRLICLVQSNDPRLTFEPVGAMPVMWNDAEWLDRKRGL
ncbi:barstar family protein [Frankia sp. CNm7]|nr:barstar family protein [Frankia nepalensis]MBL7509333.1 barstar family protein [Frankia nepalensis]MBL7516879.1 barstar family protein [Frankia nepalensis]